MQADFFDLLSDEQATLGNMPARLPTASWLGDFLNCEGLATLQWPAVDEQTQANFDLGTAIHEATAARYVGLEPVVEPGCRVDVESRAAVPLIPELVPISEAGAVEVPFELTSDGTVAHVPDAAGLLPRRAMLQGLYGRADYAGRDIDDQLRVIDLKTGNPDYLQMPLVAWQLRAYAVMAWEATGKKDESVLLSFAAVRGACRQHAQQAWEPACPGCRRARPTSKATRPLLENWAAQLRTALLRARALVAGAPPQFKPHPKHCGRCRAKTVCPAYKATQVVDTTAA